VHPLEKMATAQQQASGLEQARQILVVSIGYGGSIRRLARQETRPLTQR
jgi:hypothetical protein